MRSPLFTSSRPYAYKPRTSGLNHGSKTVTPISSRNCPIRLRQPNFFSEARDATKSIGPDKYTRAPCNKPTLLEDRAMGRNVTGRLSASASVMRDCVSLAQSKLRRCFRCGRLLLERAGPAANHDGGAALAHVAAHLVLVAIMDHELYTIRMAHLEQADVDQRIHVPRSLGAIAF